MFDTILFQYGQIQSINITVLFCPFNFQLNSFFCTRYGTLYLLLSKAILLLPSHFKTNRLRYQLFFGDKKSHGFFTKKRSADRDENCSEKKGFNLSSCWVQKCSFQSFVSNLMFFTSWTRLELIRNHDKLWFLYESYWLQERRA